METYRDLLVGVFVLGSVGIILGLLFAASGALEETQAIYVQTETATGLSEETRVFLQGLQIGRVTQVNPLVEETNLSFVAVLTIDANFPDGTPLRVPTGTHAIIEEPSPLTAPVIRLAMPETRAGTFLQPGDTIAVERRRSPVDLVVDLVTEFKDELMLTLEQTRTLMDQSTRTITETRGVLASTTEVLGTATPKIDQALSLLTQSLERTEQMLEEVTPRIGPLYDSVTATLGQARGILQSFDTIAVTANGMLLENRQSMRDALEHLLHTTVILENFANQVSRRPTRMLTGVQPPVLDTTAIER